MIKKILLKNIFSLLANTLFLLYSTSPFEWKSRKCGSGLYEKFSLISELVCIIRFIAQLEEARMSASMIHLFIEPNLLE